jgi:hypothetical protein
MHERALGNAVEFRKRRPDVPCVDVGDAELTGDPIAAVARIYDALGAKLSSTAESGMREFLRTHPPGQHGQHHYTAERYGLRGDEIEQRFRAYRRHFAAFLEADR